MLRPILLSIILLTLPAGVGLAEEQSTAPERQAEEPAGSTAEGGAKTDGEATARSEAAVRASAREHAAVESEVEKYFRRYGYVQVKRNGQTYYCRDESTLGTRVKKPVCITEEIAQQRRESARRAMEEKFGRRSWVEGT